MAVAKTCPKCKGQMAPGTFQDGTSSSPAFGWESQENGEWFDYVVYRCTECNFIEFYAVEEE